MVWSEIDFLVVAANLKESEPLTKVFRAKPVPKSVGDSIQYWHATVRNGGGTYSVILMRVGRGSAMTAASLKSAIERWTPNHVIMGGIAAGIPGRSKLGDLLVSRALLDASEWKQVPSGDRLRDRPWPCDRELVEAAESFVSSSNWKRVVFGTIISQSNLVKDKASRDWLLEHASGDDPLYERIVGIEMEGGGIAAASDREVRIHRPGILMVKGVVDYANYRKGDRYQQSAALQSAEFIHKFIGSGPVAAGSQSAVLARRGLEGVVRLKRRNQFEPSFWIELLKEPKKEFDLIGHALNKWCAKEYRTHFTRTLLRVAKANGTVRMIVMHPDGDNARRWCQALRLTEGSYRHRTMETLHMIYNEVIRKLDKKSANNIKVHWIDDIDFRYMLIKTDNHVMVSPYFTATQSNENPLFVLDRNQWHSALYVEDFDTLFKVRSKAVNWKEFGRGKPYHEIS